MVTLLLASSADNASVNLLEAVLALGDWQSAEEFEHGILRRHSTRPVHLLLIEQIHIHADAIDEIHAAAVEQAVYEVLVLSRHAAKSGRPSLTLHAIGVPGEVPHGEPGFAGGRKGFAVPPSPRFAAFFRELRTEAIESGLTPEFDLTLETTHHGPVLSAPTLYLEIGSKDSEWVRRDAADCWARVIERVLGLGGDDSMGEWTGEGEVMIGLGGGHYAPRHTDVIIRSGLNFGHLLANYALVFEEQISDSPEAPNAQPGPWKHSLHEAVLKTREAYPGATVFAHLDRKSFKGWQRSAIIAELGTIGVDVRRGRDFLPEQS